MENLITENRPNLSQPRLPRFLRDGLGALLMQWSKLGSWRAVGLVASTVSSVWMARCLGPQKLGMSAMVMATLQQLYFLVGLNQDPALVRAYVGETLEPKRQELVNAVFEFRLGTALVLLALVAVMLLFRGVPSEWMLCVAAGAPLLLLGGNLPNWLLQAKQQSADIYRTQALGSILIALFALAFMRPGVMAGADLVIAGFAAVFTGFIGWQFALGPQFRFAFSWGRLKNFLPVLMQGRWLAVTGAVIYVYSNAELPLLGYLSSVADAGHYRVALVPATVMASFVAMLPTLLYPGFIELARKDPRQLWQRQCELARTGLLIIGPLSLITWSALPFAVRLLYGPAYEDAAAPATILLISKYVVALNGIFTWALWAQGRDKSMLFLMILVAALSITSNFLLIPVYGAKAAALINLASELLILGGSFTLAKRLAFKRSKT